MSARLPLSAGLDALLWQSLENAPGALENLQTRMHLSGLSAKSTVEHLGPNRQPAWEVVAADATARERFQRGFASLDAERRARFSPAHDALAEDMGCSSSRCSAASPPASWAFALTPGARQPPWPRSYATPATRLYPSWISEAAPSQMPGLSRLVNDTYNTDRDLLGLICRSIDAAALARQFESCSWPQPYFFGELFGRLALGGKDFRDRMALALDRGAVVAVFRAWPTADDAQLYDLAEALAGLASFDDDLALDVCVELAPAIAKRWQARFAVGYSELFDLVMLLGFGPEFLRQRQPDRRQRQIARKLCEALDPATVAGAVSRSVEREWQGIGESLVFVGEAAPRQFRRISRLIDFDLLDDTTAEFWPQRAKGLTNLLVGLAQNRENEPAATWVTLHVPEMLRIGPLTAALAPVASAKRLRELGDVLDLSSQNHEWEIVGMALHGTAKADPDLARLSVASHRHTFTEAFGEAFNLDSAEPVIAILERLDLGELRAAVAGVDPAKAAERWAQVLRDKRVTARRAVAHLIAVALETDGPIRDVAIDLRQRFPAAARHP